MSACKYLKISVMGASIIFLLGVVLQLSGQLFQIPPQFQAYMIFIGITCMALGIVALLIIFVALLLPTISNLLNNCQH